MKGLNLDKLKNKNITTISIEEALKDIEPYLALREGEPCSHTGCLNHISHPCEGCGRVSGQEIIEFATESYKYGNYITYDGDKNNIIFGGTCFHCGKFFESEHVSLYCDECN